MDKENEIELNPSQLIEPYDRSICVNEPLNGYGCPVMKEKTSLHSLWVFVIHKILFVPFWFYLAIIVMNFFESLRKDNETRLSLFGPFVFWVFLEAIDLVIKEIVC